MTLKVRGAGKTGLGSRLPSWRRKPGLLVAFLLSARWAAWSLAVALVAFDWVPAPHSTAAVAAVPVTLAQNVIAMLYLPLRHRVRRALARIGGRRIDDILVASLLDVVLALGIVALTGGLQSPYYLFAVATLLMPASVLGFTGTLVVAFAFVAGYVLAESVEGGDLHNPSQGTSRNTFALFLAVPLPMAVLIQLLSSMTRRLAAEERRARRALNENVRLQREREKLAAEHERTRIAREIHDGVGQSMYVLSLNLEDVADSAEPDSSIGHRLQPLVILAKQTLLDVREYIFDLRPLLSGEEGIGAALENQARQFSRVTGLPVSVEVVGNHHDLPVLVSSALYRITQEALANTYRHARASRAWVRLVFSQQDVTLEIEDDGVGIAQEQDAEDSGLGLRHIRERAQGIRGRATLESTPGRGTVVRIVVPLTSNG